MQSLLIIGCICFKLYSYILENKMKEIYVYVCYKFILIVKLAIKSIFFKTNVFITYH